MAEHTVKLKFESVAENNKHRTTLQSTLTSDGSGSLVQGCLYKLDRPPFADSDLLSKLDEEYFLKDYLVKENGQGSLVFASGYTDTFRSWLDTHNDKPWRDFEDEFKTIFRSITRGLMSLYAQNRGHGNLMNGIAISSRSNGLKTKLFGMVAKEGIQNSVRDDRENLKELLHLVLSVTSCKLSDWTRDLSNLHEFCKHSHNQKFSLEIQCLDMQWNLYNPYFFSQREKVKFIRRVATHIRVNDVKYGDYHEYLSSHMKKDSWKEEILEKGDPSLALVLSKVDCDEDMGGLMRFTHFLLEHFNECHKETPQLYRDIEDVQRLIDSVFPDYIGALQYALVGHYDQLDTKDRADKAMEFLAP